MIYGPKPVAPQFIPKDKKRDDSDFQNAFNDLLQIMPNIFEEIVMGSLGSKISARNKGKVISRKKSTTGLVQGGVELVGEREKEKVLEVRVSTRGRIIRNTRKM